TAGHLSVDRRGAGRVPRARGRAPPIDRTAGSGELDALGVPRPPTAENGQRRQEPRGARPDMSIADPLNVSEVVDLGGESATVFRIERLEGVEGSRLARRPRTVRVLLENILRHFDTHHGDLRDVRALANGSDPAERVEFAYYPERVLLQDFTGIPVLVDLSTLRSAAVARGLAAERVNPTVPVDLIVDHSVQVDSYGSAKSLLINLDREYERNHERYRFLQWAKEAYANYRIV